MTAKPNEFSGKWIRTADRIPYFDINEPEEKRTMYFVRIRFKDRSLPPRTLIGIDYMRFACGGIFSWEIERNDDVVVTHWYEDPVVAKKEFEMKYL